MNGAVRVGEWVTIARRPPASSRTTTGALVTPGDVLAYRKMWDPYVMGIARALQTVADAWAAMAAGQTPSVTLNVQKFAVPPSPSTMQVESTTYAQFAQGLVTLWNVHAGISDMDLLAQAPAILQDFQATVQRAGATYAPQVRDIAPGLALPDPPSSGLQAQVIGQIEGLGVVAHGILQLMGVGASGALETLGNVAATAKAVVTSAASALPAIGVGAALLGLGLLAFSRRR